MAREATTSIYRSASWQAKLLACYDRVLDNWPVSHEKEEP
jgi:hypothetical protein